MKFKLKSDYKPTGDQPKAIEELVKGIADDKRHQTLLGVTGSGKTFTMANVIEQTQLPTLVISHNKTLAAQLYQEFRDFFPENAVSYFVSYYDYYQPEAYVPSTDTYIEKETNINDEIDKLRLSTTTNLLTRPDSIVVASVSCIYNLGSPVEYGRYVLEIIEGQLVNREDILSRLIDLQYSRSDYELKRGSFRERGDVVTIWPAYEDTALKLTMLDKKIEKIARIDPLTGKAVVPIGNDFLEERRKLYLIYPAKHYMTNPKTQDEAFRQILADLKERLDWYKKRKKVVEAYRLEQKVKYDLDSIKEFGFVNGIENYSRYFDGRKPGEPPFTLLDYFKYNSDQFNHKGFLTIVDESHITLPQIRGMYRGDRSRKETLIDFGFRLPAALDNRPLKFEETMARLDKVVYTSATPNEWEISQSDGHYVEQLIRPTGLIDPVIEIRKSEGQIDDLTFEILIRKQKGERVLVTTLTKKMAEALTEYLNDEQKLRKLVESSSKFSIFNSFASPAGGQFTMPKVQYLHADVETLERSDILADLRRGEYDVVVGINLLREGLDLPEVSLVVIIDADKEGFLRSDTSLIQSMGRAARHINGLVIMYADTMTGSMSRAIAEVKRRRDIQIAYNLKNNIMPLGINKPFREELIKREAIEKANISVIKLSKKESVDLDKLKTEDLTPKDRKRMITGLNRRMNLAAKEMDFELALVLRDKIAELST